MSILTGQGPIALPGGTSVVFTTPYPIQPGQRAKDTAGNEYVFCAFASTVYGGAPVRINSDYTAEAVGLTGRGPVGIVALPIASTTGDHKSATSDNAGWVQIYGRCMMQLGSTSTSPSDDANGPTTLDTTAQTNFVLSTSLSTPAAFGWVSGNTSLSSGFFVEGIKVATDSSVSNSVTAAAVTGGVSYFTGHQCAVFLNYPHIVHRNYGE